MFGVLDTFPYFGFDDIREIGFDFEYGQISTTADSMQREDSLCLNPHSDIPDSCRHVINAYLQRMDASPPTHNRP